MTLLDRDWIFTLHASTAFGTFLVDEGYAADPIVPALWQRGVTVLLGN